MGPRLKRTFGFFLTGMGGYESSSSSKSRRPERDEKEKKLFINIPSNANGELLPYQVPPSKNCHPQSNAHPIPHRLLCYALADIRVCNIVTHLVPWQLHWYWLYSAIVVH